MFSYHLYPPYVALDTHGGLGQWLVQQLNQSKELMAREQLHGRNFCLVTVKRPELNKRLAEGEQGLVLWAAPEWFKEISDMTSSRAIFFDSDIFVSLARTGFEYQGTSSMQDQRVGVMAGYFILNLDALKQSGIEVEQRYATPEELLSALNKQQISVAIMARSAYLHAISKRQADVYHVSKVVNEAYSRKVLATRGVADTIPVIDRFLSDLINSQLWRDQLRREGLEALVNPMDLNIQDLYEIQNTTR